LASLPRRARQVDLVHAHDARAHTWAALAGGAPLIVSRRVGFPARTSIGSRWKYGRAAGYLAVSEFVAGRLKEAGVPEKKIRVVYDGVPLPPPGRPQPGRVVALAGKPLEASDLSIHLSADLWHDLSTASIFVYVSQMEGLGSAALAAMAAGVPVIASRVGGLPEIVEHERTGLLISRGEMTQALRRLLADPAAAAQMGGLGRQRVEEKFTVETMVESTLRAYQEVLQC
jgi:glycosyltransferase involved in cell wall biosynthesis